NNTFAGVGKRGELRVPSGATHVDLTGKTVMPAMVDIHSHLGFLKQSDGSMSKENFNRENMLDHLNRYAYHGFAAVMSSGTDMGELTYQLRDEGTPTRRCFGRSAGDRRGPEPGPPQPARNDGPDAVTTEGEARAAVLDLAPHHPDFVKIWVDDRNGRQKKLTPPLYIAAADEALKQSLRPIAHVFDLDDAKGLLRAGVVGFVHMVRDQDIDDEMIALLKQHPGVFFGPNIGITSCGLDAGRPGWLDAPLLHETIPPAQIQKLEQSFANRKPDVLARTREDWERAKRNIVKLRANGV